MSNFSFPLFGLPKNLLNLNLLAKLPEIVLNPPIDRSFRYESQATGVEIIWKSQWVIAGFEIT